VIDTKSVISENKLAHSTRIKRISIKKDDNENNKNNFSEIVDRNKNIDKIKENNNNNGEGKTVNIIKILNQPMAYDKTKGNPITTNNNPNIYNPVSENNNKIESKKEE
jgi:hypothetical protein